MTNQGIQQLFVEDHGKLAPKVRIEPKSPNASSSTLIRAAFSEGLGLQMTVYHPAMD